MWLYLLSHTAITFFLHNNFFIDEYVTKKNKWNSLSSINLNDSTLQMYSVHMSLQMCTKYQYQAISSLGTPHTPPTHTHTHTHTRAHTHTHTHTHTP